MDSVTQAALGATVAGVAAGRRCNLNVLLAGAVLGTLPDLDVLIDYGDPVKNTVYHRGFTHSLLILLPFSLLLAWLVHKFARQWTFTGIWLITASTLLTHPLLDAFTTYGTQLTWPIAGYYALGSIFIVDPLYTLPLLIAIGLAIFLPRKAMYCTVGLLIATLYLCWSVVAKQMIEARTYNNLVQQDLPLKKVILSAAPFTTLLWRVVVLDGNTYHEGYASLLDKDSTIHFITKHRGNWPIASKPESLQMLETFSDSFLRFSAQGNALVVGDLRMGSFDFLVFQFQLAEKNHGIWRSIAPVQVESERMPEGIFTQTIARLLGDQSVFREPPTFTEGQSQ